MTEVMTEEPKVEEQPKIFEPEEIDQMFDVDFLPKMQEFAKRTKKDLHPEKDIPYFIGRMELKFVDLENPLTYESIKKDVNLQLIPVFQEDLDKSAAKSAAETKLRKIIDEAKEEYEAELKRIDGEPAGDVGDEPA